MRQCQSLLPRALVSVLVALVILSSDAFAQSASDTISLNVVSPDNPCVPDAAMTVGVTVDSTPVYMSAGDSSSYVATQFTVNAWNASCDPWSVGAQVSDFTLQPAGGHSFPGSTVQMNAMYPTGGWAAPLDPQPLWVQNLPPGLNTTPPSMASYITFSGSPAVGNTPLISSSGLAQYGSPGNWTARFSAGVKNVPTDLPAGRYTATLTVAVQGGD